MVAKISSGSSLYSALAYNHQKINAGNAKVLFTNNMVEPKDGSFSIGICTGSFEPYLLANKRTENPVIHISLNPDPKDKLNDEQFAQIAEEYMQKLGYGNQPFVVYKHEDIDRHHIHIVSVKVDETGKMIRDNFQHRLSMRICRELERKYRLVPANEKQKSASYSLKPVESKKGNIKQQIANVIRPAAENWHFQSLKEYKALLSIYNVELIEVKGIQNGKAYEGIVYAAVGQNGKVVSILIKSSRFGKEFGKNGIEKRIEKSKEIIKTNNLKESPKAVISKAMATCKNKKDFEKQLLKNQISVLFRENESGRIYGVTFIDYRQKFVFNGSRLGKEFSANVFQEKFNGNEQRSEQKKLPEFVPHQSTFTPDYTLENLSGLLTINSRGENPEEEAFIRRMKRKKRRKRKL
jgi:hypothetical protein